MSASCKRDQNLLCGSKALLDWNGSKIYLDAQQCSFPHSRLVAVNCGQSVLPTAEHADSEGHSLSFPMRFWKTPQKGLLEFVCQVHNTVISEKERVATHDKKKSPPKSAQPTRHQQVGAGSVKLRSSCWFAPPPDRRDTTLFAGPHAKNTENTHRNTPRRTFKKIPVPCILKDRIPTNFSSNFQVPNPKDNKHALDEHWRQQRSIGQEQ